MTFDSVIPAPHQNSYPPREIANQTLRNKTVESSVEKYPLTDQIIQTMRKYCEDEEIKEFDQL